VGAWQCAGRLNATDALMLSEEERLRIAARTIELVRMLDPETPVLLSLDQPWAENLSRRAHDSSPLHFADALIRAGVGLQGLMLEMNVGYHPGGTQLRDPLELSRMLDYWSLLGLPVHVTLCAPSAWHEDPLAQRRVRLVPGSWTDKAQQTWINRWLPVILAKPFVQGVLWNQLRDGEPHEFPHGGLFDLRRHAKPALRILGSLRQAHLK
jgi:hypothetical protein